MPVFAVPGVPLSPADSARAVAQVYTISLAATAPLVAAAAAALALRHRPAGSRALVWRCAVVGLLVVYLARLLPARSVAWILPGALASPVVALGRAQLEMGTAAHSLDGIAVEALLVAYVLGVLLVALPAVRRWMLVRALVAGGRVAGAEQRAILDEVRAALGVRRRVRLLVHDEVGMPAACGIVRPAVLLPRDAERWDAARLRAVLLHEVAHVAAHDVAFGLAARLAAALYWFHPASWLVARGLRGECELACDDRVLAAGVRASDYAELLASVAEERWGRIVAAPALAARPGLRTRLAAIVDTRRDLRAPRRPLVMAALGLTLAVSAPAGVVQLAPTRGVLTALMEDARWDSRAYAVVHLAERPDSIAVARAAAADDPSARVRAWARFALDGVHIAAPRDSHPLIR